MTKLLLPQKSESLLEFPAIQRYLQTRGVSLARWQTAFVVNQHDTPEVILQAYAHELKPFMDKNGFQSADVINVHPKTEGLAALREKFLREHTHSEDEVRFFVDGEGQFWFHFDGGEVVALTCTKGDFLSVPRGLRHWFDLAPKYLVKAIRIFTSKQGWVADYTGSGIDAEYLGREP